MMRRYREAKKAASIHDCRQLARAEDVYEKAKWYAVNRKEQTGQKVTAHTSKSDCMDALILDAGLSRRAIARRLKRMK